MKSSTRIFVVTSLAWAAVLALVLFLLLHRTPRRAAETSHTSSVAPLAEGPAVAPDSTRTSAAPQQLQAPLVPVQLSDEQMQSIDLRTGTALYKQLKNDLSATGTVAIDDRSVSFVQTRFSGYVRQVFVNATYRYVRKGQPLFTIYSPEILAAEQELLLARENQTALSGSSIDGVASGAGALSGAAEQRLRQWEIPASQIAQIERSGTPLPEVTIEAPAQGYITEYNAQPNTFATPATRLYTIADLSRVWVDAQIFQSDLGQLRPGDAATVRVDSYPLRTFRGHIEEILPQVDMTTRTVTVRLAIENPGLLLKPGMFVNVTFHASLGRQLVVPASAVFQTGNRQIVFLYKGGGSIEPHDVVVGPRMGDDFVILKGLKAGEAIVTSAGFLIDSESQLQAASGSYAPPPPGAGAAQSASPTKVQLDLVTAPDPPRKGSNAVTVRLTDETGAALTGADVRVTFSMPAMPAMGMAAMSSTAQLTEAGGGVYRGSISLGSGGTWKVSIAARRNGQTIATRQMHLQAEGGM